MKALAAGRCRYCRTGEGECRLPDGETCGWMDAARTVCTAPGCLSRWFAERKPPTQRTRKRTPGDIHALMLEEKRATRRRSRERRKGRAA